MYYTFMTLPDLTLASICLKGTSLAKQSVKRQNNDYCTDFRWRIAYNRVQIPLFDIVSWKQMLQYAYAIDSSAL